jgi:hypothetical protein
MSRVLTGIHSILGKFGMRFSAKQKRKCDVFWFSHKKHNVHQLGMQSTKTTDTGALRALMHFINLLSMTL